MQSNIQQYYPSFHTFYESHFSQVRPVPHRSGTWILDLSHDPIWAIRLAEVRKFHQHHDRMYLQNSSLSLGYGQMKSFLCCQLSVVVVLWATTTGGKTQTLIWLWPHVSLRSWILKPASQSSHPLAPHFCPAGASHPVRHRHNGTPGVPLTTNPVEAATREGHRDYFIVFIYLFHENTQNWEIHVQYMNNINIT